MESGADIDGEARLHYLGDVNGDGFGDVLVVRHQGNPTRVLLGSASGLREDPASTSAVTDGWALAAGDLDRDGYGDAVSWGYSRSACDVFRGGPGGLTCSRGWPELDRPGAPPPRRLAVVSPGDLDGDGQSDLVASYDDGAVYAWRGAREAPPVALGPLLVGPPPRGLYGQLVGPGDLDGDGRSDFVAHVVPTNTPLVIGYGQAGGALARVATAPEAPNSVARRFAVRAGDLDGDGFADVAFFTQRNLLEGGVTILGGTATGPSASHAWTLRAADAGLPGRGFHGFSVAGPGDLDGDGFDDLAVGQPDTDGAGTGVVHVYRGGPGGPSPRPSWTLSGLRGDVMYGAALTSPDQQPGF